MGNNDTAGSLASSCSFLHFDDGEFIIVQAIGVFNTLKTIRAPWHALNSSIQFNDTWKMENRFIGPWQAHSWYVYIYIYKKKLFGRKTTWHFPARINILFDKFQCDRDTLSWWPLDGRRGEFKDHWMQIMFLPIYLLGIRLAWPMTGGVLSLPYFFYVLPIFFFSIFFVFLASPTYDTSHKIGLFLFPNVAHGNAIFQMSQ